METYLSRELALTKKKLLETLIIILIINPNMEYMFKQNMHPASSLIPPPPILVQRDLISIQLLTVNPQLPPLLFSDYQELLLSMIYEWTLSQQLHQT